MANVPSPEDIARAILEHFGATNTQAGHVIRRNELALNLGTRFVQDEMLAGLKFAGDSGWIETAQRNAIRLTPAGFAEMRLTMGYPLDPRPEQDQETIPTVGKNGIAAPWESLAGRRHAREDSAQWTATLAMLADGAPAIT
jgi:hypothetical protein